MFAKIKNAFIPLKSGITTTLILLVFTLLNFSPYLILQHKMLNYDWEYFNTLAYVIDLAIFHYHTFPLYDPYVCGGMDILANPQSYIFSPLILLNFLFSPYWSNVFSLMICSVIGGFGMIKLLIFFKIEKNLSIIGALIFLSSNWFGMHFLEGHIPYRSMQLIPLAIYFIFLLEKDIKYILYLSLLMAFFLVEGGVYAFNFSLFFLVIALCFGVPSLKEIIKIIRKNISIFVLIVVAFLMIISVKLLPTLLLINHRTPELHFHSFAFRDLFLSFLYPFNLLQDQKIDDEFHMGLRMHEYVCYIGYSSLMMFLFLFLQKWQGWNKSHKFLVIKNAVKQGLKVKINENDNKKIAAFLLVSLWIGTGFGRLFNPWTIFIFTPFLNNAHVQSRFLIFFFVFFTIFVVKALSNLKQRYFFAALILIELTFVRIYPVFVEFSNANSNQQYSQFLRYQDHNVIKTVEYLSKDKIYFTNDRASKYCYDKAQISNDDIIAADEKKYRGEFYSLDENGELSLHEFSLNRLSASYSGNTPQTFIFNTHYLLGWQKENGDDYEIKPYKNLLAVTFYKSPIDFSIKYYPFYFKYILLSFIFGIVLYLIIFARYARYKA